MASDFAFDREDPLPSPTTAFPGRQQVCRRRRRRIIVAVGETQVENDPFNWLEAVSCFNAEAICPASPSPTRPTRRQAIGPS